MDEYQDDWWRKWNAENQQEALQLAPPEQAKPLETSGTENILGMVGSYWGPVGAGVGAAAGSLLDSRVDPTNQNKLGKAINSGVNKAVNSYITQGLMDGGGDLIKTDASTLGDTYKLAPDASMDYRIGAKIDAVPEGITTAPKETSFIDKAAGMGMNYLKGASRGLIGGDYTPIESSAVKYPDEGGFGNDFVKGMSSGGGYDKTIGYLRGGNYGGALGQQAGSALEQALSRQQAYSPGSYKKRNRYAAQ